MPRIFTQHALDQHAQIELERDATAHLVKVLRIKVGDRVTLFNGDGFDYTACVIETGKSARLAISDKLSNDMESALTLTLAQGISRGDRMDYSIQKSVELGVTAIQPLITEKSNFVPKAGRIDNKLRHWRAVIVSACEQCGRSIVPDLLHPVPLAEWLASRPSSERGYVLAPGAKSTLAESVSNAPCSVLIGPESGLSVVEVSLAQDSGMTSVSLGPRILRTETAAVAAIATINATVGDFRHN